jgi:hypothetical protein
VPVKVLKILANAESPCGTPLQLSDTTVVSA